MVVLKTSEKRFFPTERIAYIESGALVAKPDGIMETGCGESEVLWIKW